MGTSNDPRLSEERVRDLLRERDALERERSRLSARIQEINCQIQASGEAKLWDRRKETIAAATALLDVASDADLESWLAFPGPVTSRAELREIFAGAQRGAGLHKAWRTASWLMGMSGTAQP